MKFGMQYVCILKGMTSHLTSSTISQKSKHRKRATQIENIKRNSKIPKGQTEIVKSRTDKTMANKKKRKTNIEHTTLH